MKQQEKKMFNSAATGEDFFSYRLAILLMHQVENHIQVGRVAAAYGRQLKRSTDKIVKKLLSVYSEKEGASKLVYYRSNGR